MSILPDWADDPIEVTLSIMSPDNIRDWLKMHERDIRRSAILEAAEDIPTNWCDALLTGPDSPGPLPWGCPQIVELLHGIRDRLRDRAEGEDETRPVYHVEPLGAWATTSCTHRIVDENGEILIWTKGDPTKILSLLNR